MPGRISLGTSAQPLVEALSEPFPMPAQPDFVRSFVLASRQTLSGASRQMLRMESVWVGSRAAQTNYRNKDRVGGMKSKLPKNMDGLNGKKLIAFSSRPFLNQSFSSHAPKHRALAEMPLLQAGEQE
jgi:hypothetical protein